MRRLIILAVAATLTLSACGTGTGDGRDGDLVETPSTGPSPTAEALPTPTPTHGTPTPIPEDLGEGAPVADLEPARVTAGEGHLFVWNAGGEFLDLIAYDIKPKDAVAKFTEWLNPVEPFLVTVKVRIPPSVTEGSLIENEGAASSLLMKPWLVPVEIVAPPVGLCNAT